MAEHAKGDPYVCIAPRQFPARPDSDAPLIDCITAYAKKALRHGVKAWFDGGRAISGRIAPKAGAVHTSKRAGERPGDIEGDKRASPDRSLFATPIAVDDTTWSYNWAKERARKDGDMVTLPEFYQRTEVARGKERWVPMQTAEVADEIGSAKVTFPRKQTADPHLYVNLDEADSCWKTRHRWPDLLTLHWRTAAP